MITQRRTRNLLLLGGGLLLTGMTGSAGLLAFQSVAVHQAFVQPELANPVLAGATATSSVSFDSVSGMYRYDYSFSNAAASTGWISDIHFSVIGGPDALAVFSGGRGDDYAATPMPSGRLRASIVPLDVFVPPGWEGFVGLSGNLRWGMGWDINGPGALIPPGQTATGFYVKSPAPPGTRIVSLVAAWDGTLPNTRLVTDPVIKLPILAPVALEEGEGPQFFFRGGSNNPAVVDRFLSYRLPTQKTTVLAAGQKAVVVPFFGETTIPSTFQATWNGQDVSSRFVAAPGRYGAVALEPQSGRNVLVISIQGAKPGGGVGTDTDRLLWDAP